jgi:hypothetical protein
MKPRNEEQKLTEGQTQTKKARFKIEKLEERIAPAAHYNPHGELVGHNGCHGRGCHRSTGR